MGQKWQREKKLVHFNYGPVLPFKNSPRTTFTVESRYEATAFAHI